MRTIHCGLVVLGVLICLSAPARADVGVSIGIGLPHVSIGINLGHFPEFRRVPGYPVYYAPRVRANYFFYDGLFWVFEDDGWYASYWFNGPWWFVEPEFVPLFVLRVPVFYYMRPPGYFRGWHLRRPPHWDDHWGHDWKHRHSDWDRWDSRSAPPPAPLPLYQREYSKDRYPRDVEEQRDLHDRHYRHQPRDSSVRKYFGAPERRAVSAPVERDGRRILPQPYQPTAPVRKPEVREQRYRYEDDRHERDKWGPRSAGPEQRVRDRDRDREPRSKEREDGRESRREHDKRRD